MRRLSSLFVLAVLCGTLLFPSAAFARVSEYQVQYTPRGASGTGQLIVNVVLSPETELPATVKVPLPVGATVVWSGEIVGPDPTADPFREAVVTAAEGGLIATFTMEQVRVAQVEANLPAPSVSGDEVTAALNWVNTGEEGTYTFAVVLEAGARDVAITPAPVGDPARNDAGETLRTLMPVRLATGQEFSVDVRYGLGGEGATGNTTSTALVIVAVLLGIALVGLLVVLRVQRATPRPAAPGASSPSAADPPGGRAETRADEAEQEIGPVRDERVPDPGDSDFFTFD
ncbi:MAG TPA: hypothetical protein VFE45_05560 [Coriobacteriia bacterium]|nr:hypothetical protein [Coriobacteriia bacterium]